ISLVGLVELAGLLTDGLGDAGLVSLIVGVISSALFSYLAIAWLIDYLKNRNTWVFVWYRIAFGVAILIAISRNLLPNG
ncbi:MAG: undecaprenyl-diphosphatase, partial [Symploca sp. SIO2E6]|nr:undecaprenyl-diphosphatase [Symploca sp. SIO2E6]